MHQEAARSSTPRWLRTPSSRPPGTTWVLLSSSWATIRRPSRRSRRPSELAPGRPETRLYIGRIYELLGAYDEAVAVYQEELRVNIGKDHADAYNALARGQYLAGDYRRAVEIAYQAELRDPNYVEALYKWGRAEAARGDYEQAIKQFQEAKEVLERGPT